MYAIRSYYVYGGLVNKNIVAQLQALGMNAIGLTGADLNYMQAVKRPVKTIDYGFVGDIVAVNRITSYNVCYTKLLRSCSIISRTAMPAAQAR